MRRDWWKSLLLQGAPSGLSTQRLDGRSKTLLAASIKALPHETPGWITNKEAKQLFSPMEDEYLRRNGRKAISPTSRRM